MRWFICGIHLNSPWNFSDQPLLDLPVQLNISREFLAGVPNSARLFYLCDSIFTLKNTNRHGDAGCIPELSRSAGERLPIPGRSDVVEELFRRSIIPGLLLDLSCLKGLLALQIREHQLAQLH